MSPAKITALVCVFSFFLAVYLVEAEKRQPRRPCYETAVNATLDMTLAVGSEMRAQHPTWQQIQNEVARRLNVKRTEPWEKK